MLTSSSLTMARRSCGGGTHVWGGARLVQEHLRNADIPATTVYTRVTRHEPQQAPASSTRRPSVKIRVVAPRDSKLCLSCDHILGKVRVRHDEKYGARRP